METASLQLPKDLIESAIKQHTAAAIAAALSGREAIIDRAIQSVLSMKVGRNGERDTYGNGQLFIEWLCKEAIEKVVRQVCEEEISKIKPQVRESIIAHLQQKKSPLVKKLAEAMVDGFAASMGNKYRTTIQVEVTE